MIIIIDIVFLLSDLSKNDNVWNNCASVCRKHLSKNVRTIFKRNDLELENVENWYPLSLTAVFQMLSGGNV